MTRRVALPSVWEISSQGGEPTRLTFSGGMGPQESADGRFLYYAKRRRGDTYKWADIYKVPVNGGAETLVLEGVLLENGNWRIWKQSLVFRYWTEEQGPCAIDVLNLETSEVTPLFQFEPDTRFCFGITVSSDGQSILYSQAEGPGNASGLMFVEPFQL